MPGSTFIRIYFHAYVYLFEYFNSRNINITPASMCSCPCCRILVMIPKLDSIDVYAIFTYLYNNYIPVFNINIIVVTRYIHYVYGLYFV